jgi:hypothetical protein
MYLLDANAFMEASRLYYGFDIASGFWTWLADDALASAVGSIVAIKAEITSGTGDLVMWAGALPSRFWLEDTDDVVVAMTALAAWANDPARQYRQQAIDEFMASADLKLIAHAMVSKATLVTREQPAPESKRKIKIPDACNAFNVVWTDPFSAYRALGLRLTA